MESWKSEFEPGWRVLARIPGHDKLQIATVTPHAGKRRVHGRRRSEELSIWVEVDGKKVLIPESHIDPKKDEPYYRALVDSMEEATLAECIVAPKRKKNYLRNSHGAWTVKGKIMKMVLDETYARLTAKAKSAGA
jgi:hypothetical protein